MTRKRTKNVLYSGNLASLRLLKVRYFEIYSSHQFVKKNKPNHSPKVEFRVMNNKGGRTIRSTRLRKFKKKYKSLLVIFQVGLVWYLLMFVMISFPFKGTNALFVDQATNASNFHAGKWEDDDQKCQDQNRVDQKDSKADKNDHDCDQKNIGNVKDPKSSAPEQSKKENKNESVEKSNHPLKQDQELGKSSDGKTVGVNRKNI